MELTPQLRARYCDCQMTKIVKQINCSNIHNNKKCFFQHSTHILLHSEKKIRNFRMSVI